MDTIDQLISDIYEWESSTGLSALEKIIRSRYTVHRKIITADKPMSEGKKIKSSSGNGDQHVS